MANLREEAIKLGVSYSSLYKLVNDGLPEIKNYDKELRAYIDNLEKRLETSQYEARRLANKVSRLENELTQLKADYVNMAKDKEKLENDSKKWAIKALYAQKKLEQVEVNYKKLEEEKDELLRQESKVFGWQAWDSKK